MAFDTPCTFVREFISGYDYRYSEAEGQVTILPRSKLGFDSKHCTLFQMSHEIRPDIDDFEDEDGNPVQETYYRFVPLAEEVFQNVDWSKLNSIKAEHTIYGIDPETLIADPIHSSKGFQVTIKFDRDKLWGLRLYELTGSFKWAVRVIERRRIRALRFRTRITGN
jgi:hypothetical protein